MDRKSRAGRPPVTVFPTLLPYELPRLEAIMVERISAHMHNLPLAKWGLVADYLRALIIKQLMYGFCTSTTKLCEVLCAMPPHLDHQGKGSGSIEQVCEMLQGVRGEMWDVALYAEQLGLLVESECRWDLPLKRQVNFDRLWEMVVQSDPLIGDLLKIDIHAAGVPSKYIDLVRRFAIATHVRTDADGWCRLKTAEFAAILAIVPDKCREIARCAHDIRVVLADYECDAGITLLTALPRQVNTSRIAELKSLSEGGLKPPPSSSKHGLLENHFGDVSPEPAAESRGDRIYLHGLGDLLIRAGLSEK
ncbi:MAG TPA: hypothetical protein PKC18_11945, partial [Lacipirellulaceae bacterium]|nr:hypothetical protein [Lacipirellulaceae bacterium]